MQIIRIACCGLLVSCLLGEIAHGQSKGRWRLPSTTAQVFGYGVGPGHHAPMVRAPCHRPPRVQRITVVPCRCEPFCRDMGCQSMGTGCGCARSLPMQPPQPTLAPASRAPELAVQQPRVPAARIPGAIPSAMMFAPPAPAMPSVE